MYFKKQLQINRKQIHLPTSKRDNFKDVAFPQKKTSKKNNNSYVDGLITSNYQKIIKLTNNVKK